MEDLVKLSVGIVVLIFIVMIIAAAGTVLLVIAAAVGVGWLIVMGVKRLRAHLNAVRAVEQQQRLETEAARRRLAEHRREVEEQKLLVVAQEQESLAVKLQEEAERQAEERQEAERQEQERIRQREEEAARERLEAEQHKVTKSLAPWSSIINCPTPQQADEIVGKASSMHSHTGKFLHVMALVGQTGVIVTWKVHTADTSVPQVIGLRDGTVMFSGWAYAGQYSTRLSTGRYALSFVVNQAGRPKDDTDLSFEIVIPDGNAAPSADQFKRAVDATTQDFIKRTKTVAKAKRKVKQTLTAQGSDPDEIDGELGKLEVRLKDLDGTA